MAETLPQIKICLVSSGGGHLFQMMKLQSTWKNYNKFWVTFNRPDINSLLRNEKKYYAFYPESRNLFNALRNIVFAVYILRKEKPSLIISCGAGIAPPFFYVGKLFGARLIYIEPYDFIEFPSLTGKLVEPIVDELLVQHKKQLRFYKKARYKGSLL